MDREFTLPIYYVRSRLWEQMFLVHTCHPNLHEGICAWVKETAGDLPPDPTGDICFDVAALPEIPARRLYQYLISKQRRADAP